MLENWHREKGLFIRKNLIYNLILGKVEIQFLGCEVAEMLDFSGIERYGVR